MTFKPILPLTGIAILLIAAIPAKAQQPPSQQQAIVLKRQIQLNHFSPRPVNDSLSSDIFNAFVKAIDGQHEILLAGEYKLLAAYQNRLDDELSTAKWEFLDLATKLYRAAMIRTDSLIKEILKKPVDFSVDENLVRSKKDIQPYAKDAKELKARWTRWFKFLILNRAYSITISDSTKPLLKDVLAKNEASIREKLSKTQAKIFSELLDPVSVEKELKQTYFNAIASCFDPHTNFFSPEENEGFKAALSTQDYSYGFEVDETKDGKIVVAALIPGGPAWKTGEIHKDDELLQLQANGKPAVDIATISIDDVDDILSGSGQDKLTIKIKKTNGTIRTVTVSKEKIETEQDVVKGYLLAGSKKIGYISLPDFYTTWEDETGSGCANDMAKEIIKLKKENIDGLVLDLRYNGGGSLYEALQLCGIFIDEGPLVGVRDKTGKVVFNKDPNRGTIYDGPLVVMINNQSASASEMVAAALQDYNRAVIVGSPSYGKATMQVVFPMDTSAGKKTQSPNGYVKLTTGKLYRLTGETAQSKGVIPDILLPDAYEGLEYREKFQPHVLPADTSRKNGYYKPLAALPLPSLASKSGDRVKNDPAFGHLITAIRQHNSERNTKITVPLLPVNFEKWVRQKEADANSMDEKAAIDNKLFITGNHQMEKDRLKNNVFAASINESSLKNIQGDLYIKEVYQIITDLINLRK